MADNQKKHEIAKLCLCGCGIETKIAERNRSEREQIKGMPVNFIRGHNLGKAENNPWWKGGKKKTGTGKYVYWEVKAENHPKVNKNGYIREHVLVVEKALGKYLPQGSEIHHVNGNGLDNRNFNLVLCQDRSYHFLLHKRKRQLLAQKEV